MMLITALAMLGLAVSVLARKKQSSFGTDDSCDKAGCETVLLTSQAALFAGLPNTVLGIFWYAALALWSIAKIWMPPPQWLDTMMVLGAAATMGVSIYLMVTLFFLLRQSCSLCYTAHAINIVILCLLLLG